MKKLVALTALALIALCIIDSNAEEACLAKGNTAQECAVLFYPHL